MSYKRYLEMPLPAQLPIVVLLELCRLLYSTSQSLTLPAPLTGWLTGWLRELES